MTESTCVNICGLDPFKTREISVHSPPQIRLLCHDPSPLDDLKLPHDISGIFFVGNDINNYMQIVP